MVSASTSITRTVLPMNLLHVNLFQLLPMNRLMHISFLIRNSVKNYQNSIDTSTRQNHFEICTLNSMLGHQFHQRMKVDFSVGKAKFNWVLVNFILIHLHDSYRI